jgi:hypothetical protein
VRETMSMSPQGATDPTNNEDCCCRIGIRAVIFHEDSRLIEPGQDCVSQVLRNHQESACESEQSHDADHIPFIISSIAINPTALLVPPVEESGQVGLQVKTIAAEETRK